MPQLTKVEESQAIKLQDAIGEIVDQYLRGGLRADIVEDVLRDEARSVPARQKELEDAL